MSAEGRDGSVVCHHHGRPRRDTAGGPPRPPPASCRAASAMPHRHRIQHSQQRVQQAVHAGATDYNPLPLSHGRVLVTGGSTLCVEKARGIAFFVRASVDRCM